MAEQFEIPQGQGGHVATTPVVARRGARGTTRWLVAGGLTAVAAILVAAFVVLGGQRAGVGSAAPGYLPAGTLVYVDARLDLPGDQGQQVAAFLSRFPGFADRSALPAKLDDVLTRLVRSASKGKVDYDGQIKPWFGGQIAFGLTKVPASGAVTGAGSLALFSVSDAATARTDLAAMATAAGATVSDSTTYRGATLETLADASDHGTAVLGLTSDMLLVGRTADEVKAALDVDAGQSPSLAASSRFSDAVSGLRTDRLGTLYVDLPELTKAAGAALGSGPEASMLASLPQPVGAVAGEVHTEGDRLVASFRAAKGPDAPNLSARTSDLAQYVPSGALAYVETHDTGQLLGQTIDGVIGAGGSAADGTPLQALKGYLTLLGGPDELLGWIKDAGVAVTAGADGRPQAGLVALASDADTARSRLKQWLGLLALAGSQGSGIATSEEQVDGTTITIIHLDQGSSGPLGGAGGAAQEIDLAVAAKGNLVVVGLGDAFVKQVLTVDAAGSLARSDRYTAALAAAGGPQDSGVVWLDVSALTAHLEETLPAEPRATFEAQVKPYLDVVDHLIAVQSVDGSTFTGLVQLQTK